MTEFIERRAAIHRALGEPIRLAIIDDLTASDRSPQELASRLDLAGNLLAHHLDGLEAVGLIERFVSSADRRRRYVRLRPEPLADIGLDPRTAGAGFEAAQSKPRRKVLFVCSHNSARSPLAAGLWRARRGGSVGSAGTDPAERINSGALAAATRRGIDLGHHRPRLLDRAATTDPETTVITVCDRAHEELEPGDDWWHWSLADPTIEATDPAFDATIDELIRRIEALDPAAP